MAIYDDDARIYADLIRDKNRLKAQIASGALVAYQIKKDDSGIMYVKDWMPVIRIRSPNSDTWIWDHTSQAIWDTSTWDTGTTGAFGRWIEIMRRRWEWQRKQDFKQVVISKTISGVSTEINATHNPYYMRAQGVE